MANDEGSNKASAGDDEGLRSNCLRSSQKLSSEGKKRTRTGCLNCRRKRRKCDEKKPTCEGCRGRRERCQYGMRVSFRPENAQTVDANHASMQQGVAGQRPTCFQIVNVTREVIRDYFEETNAGEPQDSLVQIVAEQPSVPVPLNDGAVQDIAMTAQPVHQHRLSVATNTSYTGTTANFPMQTPVEMFLSPQVSESTFEDGIFLPGSQYQELHAVLRSRLIDTARSTVPSRSGTPDLVEDSYDVQQSDILNPPIEQGEDDDDESLRLAQLTAQQEYTLWQNYINEVASWLDKFDNDRHFERVLPILAKSHPHLKYSILALSARQMERLQQSSDSSTSLALYQRAIHLLSPLLHKRTSVVLASCIVLCVLEMLSCSPKAWRRHLDGCAALIQALGISGSCGSSLERALFWIFARMDICGGLISSEKTLIPISRWLGGPDMLADTAMLRIPGRFDQYANMIVYLCGQVVDLLCSSGKWEQKTQRRSTLMDVLDYNQAWLQLFEVVENWATSRPDEMKPLLTIPATTTSPTTENNDYTNNNPAKPFPTILYANGSAVSGNQMYHTAALLMLKHKPAHIRSLSPKPRSILWHARQICAISLSNNHHGCWTNSIQPLWLAGQQMSHPSEHRVILDLLMLIERETGWSTRWRQDDLRELWGSLDV